MEFISELTSSLLSIFLKSLQKWQVSVQCRLDLIYKQTLLSEIIGHMNLRQDYYLCLYLLHQ